MSRLGGVILAAGLSSRMKQFKPLMMIDGKSMIRHVIDLMRGAVESSGCILTELDVADRGTVLDNDTPEDFERLRRFFACSNAESER